MAPPTGVPDLVQCGKELDMAAVQMPLWRTVVTRVDAVIAPPLETLVRHDAVGIGLAVAGRAASELKVRSQRVSRRGLHALNIPAASDVNRLLAEFAYVERQLRVLTKAVGEASGTASARPKQALLAGAPSTRD